MGFKLSRYIGTSVATLVKFGRYKQIVCKKFTEFKFDTI